MQDRKVTWSEHAFFWVSTRSQIPESIKKTLKGLPISTIANETQLKDSQSTQYRNCVYFFDQTVRREIFQRLALERNTQKAFIAFFDETEIFKIEDLLSQIEIFEILSENASPHEVSDCLMRLEGALADSEIEKTILQDFRVQNHKLEALTQNLEKMVMERTQDIQASKNEIESKVRKIKNLVAFIQSLTSIRKIEDILILLRSELQKWHPSTEPFLACDTNGFGPWILHLRRNEVVELKTSQLWNKSSHLRIHSSDDQQYLANVFSRPFNRVLAFPLVFQESSSHSITLFIEHQLASHDVESFIEYLNERLQSLALALDRALFEIDFKRASYLWESTFDSIDDPIAIISSSGDLIRSNKMFAQMQSNMTPEFSNGISECVQSGQSVVHNLKYGPRYFECYIYPIHFSQSEQVNSVVAHLVDVTNYKSLQSAMMQNEKMSAVGHLAGNIAHELNNPLTGVRALCQILKTQVDSAGDLYRDLSEVENAAARSQKIITNLLNFSKFEETENRAWVSLSELVEQTLPLLKSLLASHTREIQLQGTQDQVLVEPHLMQQVIFNLVANACQAMPEKGEVQIRTYSENDKVYFAVQDSGDGVPQSIRHQLFDPFVTSKGAQGGTGLGLSMSKKVIERFGGEIGFESATGKGSTFWFWLPAKVIQGAKV